MRPSGGNSQHPVLVVLALVMAVGLGFWWWRTTGAGEKPAVGGVAVNATNAASSQAKPDFYRLVGKWMRPDGGYVLEIKNVDASGKMEAGYFNPESIHVAKAEASQDGSSTKVFIELRDVNYPGSTYTLTYEPGNDLLRGIYYQAVADERYEIFFSRIK